MHRASVFCDAWAFAPARTVFPSTSYNPTMPIGLKRYQQTGNLHFITFSCYHRLPHLAPSEAKDIVQRVLERTRRSHGFFVTAYVLMPEHIHLLISEPSKVTLATSLRVFKAESSKLLKGTLEHFWQPRYFDFNVFSETKHVEKVRYIHRNPVTRGLVPKPEDYLWSSFHHYSTGEPGPVEIESRWTISRSERGVASHHI
jgi:putative transposase